MCIRDRIDGTFLHEKLQLINDGEYTAIALSSLDSQPYISSGTAAVSYTHLKGYRTLSNSEYQIIDEWESDCVR